MFLCAFTTKVAVYALARGFPGTEMLVYIGAAMTCFPIFYAVIENDLRRVLAYSMINQIGFMVCGIGIGTELAVNGAVAHAFQRRHLQGIADDVDGRGAAHDRRINGSDLGGPLQEHADHHRGCASWGRRRFSAFPLLFSGFVSKSMVMSAALAEGHHWVWLALLFASAGVFHHAGIKIPFFAFFAHDSGIRTTEPPVNMLVAMGLAAGLCVLIGCYPRLLYDLLPFATDYTAYDATHVLAQLQIPVLLGPGVRVAEALRPLSTGAALGQPRCPSGSTAGSGGVPRWARAHGCRRCMPLAAAPARVSGTMSEGGRTVASGRPEGSASAWDTSRMAIVMVIVLCVFLLSI